MLNEFAYCPRLFHLEWVQSEWADNDDTADGTWKHRVVDAGSASTPLASGPPPEPKVSRSVTLSSESLGLVGKVDLLEPLADGSVVPVDYKRGSPPDVDEGAWLPERVQVCALGLLLLEAGYRCDHGVLYFTDSHQQVRVDFDDELLSTTRRLIAEARSAASIPKAPPPLNHHRKCPRCSLVGICLPDELHHLSGEVELKPRRLIPNDQAARPLYVVDQGASIRKSKGRLDVRVGGEVAQSVRLIDVSQVSIFGNAQISTQVVRELFRRDIPVLWFSYGGWFSGVAHGMPSKNVELRIGQFSFGEDRSFDVARRMIEAKIRNCRTLLMRNGRPRPSPAIDALLEAARSVADVEAAPSLLGVEGAAAKAYFTAFPTLLKPSGETTDFDFSTRNRRPPTDPVNCLLSFVYSLLIKDCTSTLLGVGLDPYLGVYHRPRFGRPALALDLAEEFRPIVGDSVVVSVINNGEVSSGDFVIRAGGVALTPKGRRRVIGAYERRLSQEVTHPRFGYRVTYRRILEVQARLVAALFKGEIDDYPGFMTR